MEGRCQLTAKQAMSKCGQKQIKGVTMATSHGSPPHGTCHTEILTGEYKVYLPGHQGPPWTKRWVGGANQRQSNKQKAKRNHEGENARQWHNYACPQWTSADQQQISPLTLIIDNLI